MNHATQEADRISLEAEEAAEQFDRFAPRGRDWWQAREEDGLPSLAEEMGHKHVDLCGFIGCKALATLRVEYRSKSWPKPVLRCADHGGHHEFTDRRVDGEWQRIVRDPDAT